MTWYAAAVAAKEAKGAAAMQRFAKCTTIGTCASPRAATRSGRTWCIKVMPPGKQFKEEDNIKAKKT